MLSEYCKYMEIFCVKTVCVHCSTITYHHYTVPCLSCKKYNKVYPIPTLIKFYYQLLYIYSLH